MGTNGRPIRQEQQPGQPRMTGIHRDTSGKVIGGYQDGVAFGTKATATRQPSWKAAPSPANPPQPGGIGGGGTVAATGNVLNQRQNLFKSMESAGAAGITPEMRQRARSLGVQDKDFNAAVARVDTNSRFTPGKSPVTAGGAATSVPGNTTRPSAKPAPTVNSYGSYINGEDSNAVSKRSLAAWRNQPTVGTSQPKPVSDSLVAGRESQSTAPSAPKPPRVSAANPKGVNFTADDVKLAQNLKQANTLLKSRAPTPTPVPAPKPQSGFNRATAMGYGNPLPAPTPAPTPAPKPAQPSAKAPSAPGSPFNPDKETYAEYQDRLKAEGNARADQMNANIGKAAKSAWNAVANAPKSAWKAATFGTGPDADKREKAWESKTAAQEDESFKKIRDWNNNPKNPLYVERLRKEAERKRLEEKLVREEEDRKKREIPAWKKPRVNPPVLIR